MINRHQCCNGLGIVTIDGFYEFNENPDRVHCCGLTGRLSHRSKTSAQLRAPILA